MPIRVHARVPLCYMAPHPAPKYECVETLSVPTRNSGHPVPYAAHGPDGTHLAIRYVSLHNAFAHQVHSRICCHWQTICVVCRGQQSPASKARPPTNCHYASRELCISITFELSTPEMRGARINVVFNLKIRLPVTFARFTDRAWQPFEQINFLILWRE
jgi:hypothetical protein